MWALAQRRNHAFSIPSFRSTTLYIAKDFEPGKGDEKDGTWQVNCFIMKICPANQKMLRAFGQIVINCLSSISVFGIKIMVRFNGNRFLTGNFSKLVALHEHSQRLPFFLPAFPRFFPRNFFLILPQFWNRGVSRTFFFVGQCPGCHSVNVGMKRGWNTVLFFCT